MVAPRYGMPMVLGRQPVLKNRMFETVFLKTINFKKLGTMETEND